MTKEEIFATIPKDGRLFDWKDMEKIAEFAISSIDKPDLSEMYNSAIGNLDKSEILGPHIYFRLQGRIELLEQLSRDKIITINHIEK